MPTKRSLILPLLSLALFLVLLAAPPPGVESATVRLVLEGYDSTYYFEWFPRMPPVSQSQRLSDRKSAKAVKAGYDRVSHKARKWSRHFY